MLRLKVMLVVLYLIIVPSVVFSAELYVQSLKIPILAEPLIGAKELTRVQRGEVLKLLEKKYMWYRVDYKGLTGWVSALLVDTKPPSGRISVIDISEEELKGGARSRASASVTAVVARGLMKERARLSDRYKIDPEGVRWIESVSVSEEEVMRFIEGGLKR